LELGYYVGQKPHLPTRKTILAEAIRLGADLSPTSSQTVQRHLDELAEAGHALKLPKGRSPWKSRYLILQERSKE
ncbi:MAG: hypothetical protein HC875_39430, partial [Anaerolineales bacterium]|nr:hypothetical protein [Anaerolineales bacterium]